MTFLKRSTSSMPVWRVRVMPVSGAQQAWKQEMLHAAVHSTYNRDGRRPASSDLTVGVSPGSSGRFSGQSPQKPDDPPFRSWRSREIVGLVQISSMDVVLASPSTRFA